MHKIKITIKTIAPVCLAMSGGDPNIVSTFRYIPGSTLLGLFANIYIRIRKNKKEIPVNDGNFRSWFLTGGLTFTNAYLNYSGYDLSPCPVSVQCKKGDDTTFYNLFMYKTDKNEKDKEITKPAGGFVCLCKNGNDDKLLMAVPETILSFHGSRDDRIKGCSTEGNIFHYEALKEEQSFTGYIIGEEAMLEEFKKTFDAGTVEKVTIGRSKYAQYGRCSAVLGDDLENFNWNFDDNNEFSILTFTSPAIIYNKFGFPEPTVSNLETYLKNKLGAGCTVTINKSFSQVTHDERFVGVWRLKTPRESAFSEGSAFRIKVQLPNGNKKNDLKTAIESLMQRGIGEKTHLGFGRFRIDWINFEDISLQEITKKIEKPKEPPPTIIKTIFDTITKNNKQLVEIKILNDLKEFKLRPSNSLLGRLGLMLITSKSPACFQNSLKELKKPAQNQLKECYKGSENLYNMLTNNDRDVSANAYKSLDELKKVISDKSNEDTQALKDEKYKKYWLTVFKGLRKENQGG